MNGKDRTGNLVFSNKCPYLNYYIRMLSVGQHKLKTTPRTHIHTKKTISTTATTNKQRTRRYRRMQLFVSSSQRTNKPNINARTYTSMLYLHVFTQTKERERDRETERERCGGTNQSYQTAPSKRRPQPLPPAEVWIMDTAFSNVSLQTSRSAAGKWFMSLPILFWGRNIATSVTV